MNLSPVGAREKPAGEAWVRVSGDVAYTQEKGKGKYRIFVPNASSITWLGAVANGQTHSGTLSKKGLVAGWNRLGLRGGAHAVTTLAWEEVGAVIPPRRPATVGKPRLNSRGQLTFLGKVRGPRIPSALPDFSINIATASMNAQPRKYPINFKAWTLDSTASLWVTAQSDTQATVSWSCGPSVTLSSPNANYIAVPITAFTCGDIAISADNSQYSFFPPTGSGVAGSGWVNAAFLALPASGAGFEFWQNIAQWGRGGGGAWPTN